MAKSLTFADSKREYDLNGKVTVRFNPTDADFMERLYRTFTDLDARQEEFQKHVEEIGDDGDKMFAYAKERDKEMRGKIDDLLGEGVSDALFDHMNCYALADGLPVWMNLLFAIAEEIEKAYAVERKKADPRMRAYTKKYANIAKKYQTARK